MKQRHSNENRSALDTGDTGKVIDQPENGRISRLCGEYRTAPRSAKVTAMQTKQNPVIAGPFLGPVIRSSRQVKCQADCLFLGGSPESGGGASRSLARASRRASCVWLVPLPGAVAHQPDSPHPASFWHVALGRDSPLISCPTSQPSTGTRQHS